MKNEKSEVTHITENPTSHAGTAACRTPNVLKAKYMKCAKMIYTSVVFLFDFQFLLYAFHLNNKWDHRGCEFNAFNNKHIVLMEILLVEIGYKFYFDLYLVCM